MINLKLFKNEPIEHALKRLRRKLNKENTLTELNKKAFYKSKSQKYRERTKYSKYLNQFNEE